GMKQCKPNPWLQFSETHKKGDRLSGKIKSITDFGVFIGLEGGIDGLVHLSDLSWDEAGDVAVKRFSKGDEVDALVLSVDPERERIALGLKQLASDPFAEYVDQNSKGSKVTGIVRELENKQARVELAEGVDAILKASDASREGLDDIASVYSVGDEVSALITSIDRRNRVINISVKHAEMHSDKAAMQSVNQKSVDVSGPTTIGDLIKAQMNKDKS
uniref:S1 RNA-binding domain-containing protein n=1 Tax=Pontibacterium sp. TaxID=2036026 RepID=UPI003561F2B3